MNVLAQKYGPPVLVLGAALYLGWPPSSPLDLGDDLVKAKSVRWNSSELDSPQSLADVSDPFTPVLVLKEEPKAAVENVVVEPTGPSEAAIRAVVLLTGIANSGGRSWAILNGKASLVGDVVKTNEVTVPDCTLVAINADHVVVRCQKMIAVIRPQVSRHRTRTSVPETAVKVAPQANKSPAAPPAPDVDASPQA